MGLLPVFIALMAGILLHDAPLHVPAFAYVLAAILFVCSCIYVRDRKVWIMLVSFLMFLAAGVLYYAQDKCRERILSYSHGKKIYVSGRITGPVSAYPDREKIILEVDRIDNMPFHGDMEDRCLMLLNIVTNGNASASTVWQPVRGDYITVFTVPKSPWNYKNPGSFDYIKQLSRNGIGTVAYINGKDRVSVDYSKTNTGLLRTIDILRYRIKHIIETYVHDRDAFSIVAALVIGEQGYISRDVRRMFASTGIIHILVVAGLHLGIITHLVYMVIKFLLSRSRYLCLHANIPKLSLLMSMTPMTGYIFISGANPPVIRSGIMIAIYTSMFLIDRHHSRWTGILIAAILILILNPVALYSVSFQLSFMSVGSIIAFMPLMTRIISACGLYKNNRAYMVLRTIISMLLISFFVTLGLGGVIAFYFNTVPVLGILLNVIVIPVFGYLILPLSLISSSAGFIVPHSMQWLSSALFMAVSWLIHAGVVMIQYASGLSIASLHVATPTLLELVLYYSMILVLLNIKKSGIRYGSIAVSLLICVSLFDAGYYFYRTHYNRELSVTFLDVGHGDSAFVEFPYGRTMLIDAGGGFSKGYDTGESVVARYIWSLKRSSVDYVVASHPQVDHIGGLGFIIRHMHTKEVYKSDCEPDTLVYRSFMDSIQASEVALHAITASAESKHINGADVTFFTVPPENPDDTCDPHSNKDINNYPVLVRIVYRDVSILFTGDIEKRAEQLLVGDYQSKGMLKATILKVPHHGSSTSNTEQFIDAVRPDIVVISAAGNNAFRRPAKSVLRRFFERGIQVLRTDRSGAIRITTDGKQIKIEKYF